MQNEDTDKSIAWSGFLSKFVQSFVPQYHCGQQSEYNLWLIAGKSAEFIFDWFKSISQNYHKSYQVTILKIKKVIKLINTEVSIIYHTIKKQYENLMKASVEMCTKLNLNSNYCIQKVSLYRLVISEI